MRLLRQPFAVSALGVLAAACVWLPFSGHAQSRRPNIVFILADDLGVNDLGAYGRRDHRTPNLDRLAADGLRFTTAYVASPICSPSRAALMTGRAPARLHITTFLPGRPDAASQRLLHPPMRQELPLGELTLAERLRAAGYVTGLIGKWHLGGAGFTPRDQGFDLYYPGQATTKPSDTEGGKGEHDLTREAERFIDANHERPFFLYLAHNNPHIPYAASQKLVDANRGAFEPAYAATVQTLDDSVGRLLAHLDRSRLRERTVVIVTSDNGGLHVPEGPHPRVTHNTPFRAGKGYLYEGGLRVPLIVDGPGLAKRRVVDVPLINTDWLPTLLELAGVRDLATTRPETVRDLAAMLEGIRRLGAQPATVKRPNIILAIADDWSFPHAGIYGDPTVSTPNFDRIAREGARFTHAFVAAPSCTPSRAALLTGQAVHRLEEGGNLHGFLPKAYAVYPDLLEQAGYEVGYTGKAWGPGRFEPGGRARNPAGPQFKSFDDFMERRAKGSPFSFWFGSTDPHRPYQPGTGAESGLKPDRVQVPGFLPDTLDVRNDLLDYYFEVQRFDRDLGRIIDALERAGELDNTIIIVTSDNGMPFPRAKATVYDGGARVPLAIRWPGVAGAGAVIDSFVSLTDVAPTVLESAGLKPLATMTGRTLLPLLRGESQSGRDRVFIERERHANVRRGDLSYPARAIRTNDYLYIRNFRADRWPAGDPQQYVAVGPFGDIDGSPSKSLLLDRQTDPAIASFFKLATAKRPAEELYDLRRDPHQVDNVAGRPAHRAAQQRLRAELDRWLRETGDPRAIADDDRWDRFPYYGQPAK